MTLYVLSSSYATITMSCACLSEGTEKQHLQNLKYEKHGLEIHAEALLM